VVDVSTLAEELMDTMLAPLPAASTTETDISHSISCTFRQPQLEVELRSMVGVAMSLMDQSSLGSFFSLPLKVEALLLRSH